jgi:hypothetical protein
MKSATIAEGKLAITGFRLYILIPSRLTGTEFILTNRFSLHTVLCRDYTPDAPNTKPGISQPIPSPHI